jgi:4-hydroxy-tetrahydrodipicolinate synthase
VSDAIDIPIMIQDAPVAGTPLSVDLLARMAREIRNISYFKIEVPMAAAKAARPHRGRRRQHRRALGRRGSDHADGRSRCRCDRRHDGGGYPDGIRQIIDPYLAGRRDEAMAAYARWLPLINYENRQCGLQAAKILMQEGGVIGSDAVRHPLQKVHPAARAGLVEIARQLDPVVLRWGR